MQEGALVSAQTVPVLLWRLHVGGSVRQGQYLLAQCYGACRGAIRDGLCRACGGAADDDQHRGLRSCFAENAPGRKPEVRANGGRPAGADFQASVIRGRLIVMAGLVSVMTKY